MSLTDKCVNLRRKDISFWPTQVVVIPPPLYGHSSQFVRPTNLFHVIRSYPFLVFLFISLFVSVLVFVQAHSNFLSFSESFFFLQFYIGTALGYFLQVLRRKMLAMFAHQRGGRQYPYPISEQSTECAIVANASSFVRWFIHTN